jgi:small subunit ribosomal protein S4
VKVNGKRVTIPSARVSEGDVIELASKMADNVVVLGAVGSRERDIPDYLEVDAKALKATYVRVPKLSDVPYPVQMEPNLVVEFYSR